MICVFQDWQERYIHQNYTHIMKDHLIETVSHNSHIKRVAQNMCFKGSNPGSDCYTDSLSKFVQTHL